MHCGSTTDIELCSWTRQRWRRPCQWSSESAGPCIHPRRLVTVGLPKLTCSLAEVFFSPLVVFGLQIFLVLFFFLLHRFELARLRGLGCSYLAFWERFLDHLHSFSPVESWRR
jgi:hypothetical protein